MSIINALAAALNAFVVWVQWQREKEIDHLEDEIDRLAADGSPLAKLRIERLAKRRRRKLEQASTQ
jgi:hypothetical protein